MSVNIHVQFSSSSVERKVEGSLSKREVEKLVQEYVNSKVLEVSNVPLAGMGFLWKPDGCVEFSINESKRWSEGAKNPFR